MREWTSGERAELARVVLTHWWQDTTPPIPNHSMGNDLSICKRLIQREGERPDRLAKMLAMYDGPPATLRIFYARGHRNVLNELRGKMDKQESKEAMGNMQPMQEILRGIVDGDAA